MKNDSTLRADILDELKWEPSVSEAEIGVAIKDGVVTLSGNVPTFSQKYAAERAVERVSGVRAVAEELKVKLPSARERSDTEIAHAAVNALAWDTEVPDTIKTKVEGGWLTLEGPVEWQFERSAAERAVRYLQGVKGVTNLIAVKPKQVSSVEVGRQIKDALRRSAELDAERIIVEAADGKVTLKGSVRSWAERVDAERAAWAAPGVTQVTDRISINV